MKNSKHKQTDAVTTKHSKAPINTTSLTDKRTQIPVTETDFIQSVLKDHLPTTIDSLSDVQTIVTTTAQLASPRTTHAQTLTTAAGQWGGLTFGILNFIQIPLLYIYSLITKKKNLITPSDAATFAFTSISLTLTVAALLIPGVAPTLGLLGTFIGSIAALTSLFNLIHNYSEAQYHLSLINDKMAEKKEMIAVLQENLRDKSIELEHYPTQKIKIMEEIQQKLIKHQAELEALIDQKKDLDETISTFKPGAIDKSIGLLLACIGIAGAIISLVFPPVGMIIISVATITGAVYGVTRLSQHIYAKYKNWKASESTTTPHGPSEQNGNESALDSTSQMFNLFSKKSSSSLSMTDTSDQSNNDIEVENDESGYSSTNDSDNELSNASISSSLSPSDLSTHYALS